MSNRHIKIINGRKYYYSSIRKGKKVTSKYLGPVERLRTRKRTFVEEEMPVEVQENPEVQEAGGEDADYIG